MKQKEGNLKLRGLQPNKRVNMTKIVLDTVSSGYNLGKINANFEKIEDQLNDKVLYRDNTSTPNEPNELEQDLDLNSNRILNLPVPTSPTEPLRLGDITSDETGATVQYVDDSITTAVPLNIINDLSQAYEFATVAAYKAFTTAFPVGKVINLLDRKAEFIVIAGTGTGNDKNIIASDQVAQSVELSDAATTTNLGMLADGSDETALAISIAALGIEVVIDRGTYQLTSVVAGNWSSFSTYEVTGAGYFNNTPSDNNIQIVKNIRVGNETTEFSTSGKRDAVIVTRSLVGETDCHAFTDNTVMSGVTDQGKYGTFDSRTEIAGNHAQDHIFSFQDRTVFSGSGTINEMAGLISTQFHTGIGVIANRYGIKLNDVGLTGGGGVTNAVGVFIGDITQAVNKIGLKIDQSNPNSFAYFAGGEGGMYSQGNAGFGIAPSATEAASFSDDGIVSAIAGAIASIGGYVGSAGDTQFNIISNGVIQLKLKNVADANSFTPGTDNLQALGDLANRWSVVFAGTGSINTSDEREKTELLSIDETERAVAVELKSALVKFKFTDAVEKKGDDARIHFGVGAQTVGAIFEKHGLDPHDYALFCYDERGDVNRYGIRYSELLCFIICAM